MVAINISDFNDHRITEKEVINRILDGEKELYEILVRRNNQKLYRIIRSYIKDEAEIEDVMQNTYIKAYTKLYQFNFEASFSTWLIRIGINESLAELKKRSRILKLNGYNKTNNDDLILEIPDSIQLNPQEKMVRRETKQLLENAIDQLDIKYRTVYMMKEVEEMSLREISQALDISLANGKIRLHRSKEMLKETLYRLSSDTDVFEFGFSRCDRITENVMRSI
ncbi:RNA polymerase sigma factor [Gramella jeungdoensis]|uniref:RNA polymerase sigma factor n=1 Tax=Gramella jeungdoensis TaxID=708091 RepID=A0ABT0YYQ4_9FLAO|nr:RNA polymerase sigma factor [Gramella jeungdoensis]MCM8568594.1 RNA polymerase sigma factor [Gramella jeungdoensis]